MPAKPSKSPEEILKAIKKQEKEASNHIAQMQREKLKLETVLTSLNRKVAALQDELKTAVSAAKSVQDDTAAEQSKLAELTDEITAGIDKRLEKDAELARVIDQIATHEALLAEKKGSLEAELTEYAAVRKQEIKDDILTANQELITLRDESTRLQGSIDAQKAELHELSTLYVQEQADVRQSTEQKDQLIADNIEAMDASTRELDKVKDEIRAAIYERDRIVLVTNKSKEDHQKFVEYEQKARKILDTKDRELQEKSAEISQANQFLQARRSFLPEL